MGTFSRLRRAAKWGGLGLAGVCVAAWCLSLVWSIQYTLPSERGVMLKGGAVWVTFNETTLYDAASGPAPGGRFQVWRRQAPTESGSPDSMHWAYTRWVGSSSGSTGYTSIDEVGVPLWMPASLGLGLGVPAWVLDRRGRRRAIAGHCLKCGYDRSTLPEGTPCPECGAGGR